MKNSMIASTLAFSAVLTVLFAIPASAQITPSDDAYTLTTSPTTNFGGAPTLNVRSAGASTYVRFDLSSIPPTVTGAMVARATLKMYVSTVAIAGSFDVDMVTSSWAEGTITANNSPTLGLAVAASVPITTASRNKYVLIDVTPVAVNWLNGTENDGLAIRPNGTVSFALNSKETPTTSHPSELDIVLSGPPGPITGVTAGGGLTGGGTKGTVTLSLLTTCKTGQSLQWNGTTWVCATPSGSGTITGVTAGTDLTGGGSSGVATLNVDTTKIPQLAAANTFLGNQSITGSLNVASSSYQAATVQSTSSFGTWLALGNSSAGGHTWNILSAGGANGEGAGNLGITDLTGKSTIFLEGNTNVSGTLNGTSVNAVAYDADVNGTNNGNPAPGYQFGGNGSGEAMASRRTVGANQFGIDFFTNYTPRLSIANNGLIGIGTQTPSYQLDVIAKSATYSAIRGAGFSVAAGSRANGGSGIFGFGGVGDLTSGSTTGGTGVSGYGGTGSFQSGSGGVFYGGSGGGGAGVEGYQQGASFAGFFSGDVLVTGNLSKGGGSFKIDHPLDPANKYLSHSFVESPDMMNIYNGNVVTDSNGDAVVPLPEWFETLNRDFRYQLTVIGQFAQAIITGEVANHQFALKTDKPGVKVSWQVTGIRQDAWANAHRIPLEEAKSPAEQGHYLHPELYGAPKEKGIAWARHPESMKRIQEMREAQNRAAAAATTAPVKP